MLENPYVSGRYGYVLLALFWLRMKELHVTLYALCHMGLISPQIWGFFYVKNCLSAEYFELSHSFFVEITGVFAHVTQCIVILFHFQTP